MTRSLDAAFVFMEQFDGSKADVPHLRYQPAVVASGPASRPREDSGEVGLKQEAPTAMLNNGRGLQGTKVGHPAPRECDNT